MNQFAIGNLGWFVGCSSGHRSIYTSFASEDGKRAKVEPRFQVYTYESVG